MSWDTLEEDTPFGGNNPETSLVDISNPYFNMMDYQPYNINNNNYGVPNSDDPTAQKDWAIKNGVWDPAANNGAGGVDWNKFDATSGVGTGGSDVTGSGEPTQAEKDALKSAGLDPSLWGSIKNAVGNAFTKTVNGKQVTDWGSIAALGGAGLGAYTALTQKPVLTGYHGTIPKYDAHRNMITAPPSDRRPGAAG